MSLTGRIRAYLILIALLPPLLVMTVIYFHSVGQAEDFDQRSASEALNKYTRFETRFKNELERKIREIAAGSTVQQAILLIKSNRAGRVDLSSDLSGVDFLEIVDYNLHVVASGHRPGLIGEPILPADRAGVVDTVHAMETIEYDINGAHAAFAFTVPLSSHMYLYSGEYISDDYRALARELLNADVQLTFPLGTQTALADMDVKQLYRRGDSLTAVLAGGPAAGFYLTAGFVENASRPAFVSLLRVTGLVALVTTLIAVALGMYITSRAKREIDNLVNATSRVAEGDFATPVMAYEEGEFAQLADSFSEMMLKLKALQNRLGTAEKIAAWQAMGRKLAHEIKNPLTPISISVDDLRRSYDENLPEFDRTLHETTSTIKSEISRLTRLLDQFSGFARMAPPQLRDVRPNDLLEPIRSLYRTQIEAGRLLIDNRSTIRSVRLDDEQIRQVLINLIKNGIETGDKTHVQLDMKDVAGDLTIAVEDDGPGFSGDVLSNNFQPYLSNKKNGSGLGLVICQRIIFDHGGAIELYNRKEGGAGVRITLPIDNGQDSDS